MAFEPPDGVDTISKPTAAFVAVVPGLRKTAIPFTFVIASEKSITLAILPAVTDVV